VATTDPERLARLGTWYLTTNLPAPSDRCEQETKSDLAPASVGEVVRLYGFRMWVEQRLRPTMILPPIRRKGEKRRPRASWPETLRAVRGNVCLAGDLCARLSLRRLLTYLQRRVTIDSYTKVISL
jgi:hypothetical protein